MINSGGLSFYLGLIWIVFFFALIIFSLYGIFKVLNAADGPKETEIATVIRKEYSDSKVESNPAMIATNIIFLTRFQPEQYKLYLKFQTGREDIFDNRALYDSTNIGDFVEVEFIRARFNDEITITNCRKIDSKIYIRRNKRMPFKRPG